MDATNDSDFSMIGRDFKFNIPFEFFNEELNKEADKQSLVKEDFFTFYDRLLKESVDDHYTPKHRLICRARLYGNL